MAQSEQNSEVKSDNIEKEQTARWEQVCPCVNGGDETEKEVSSDEEAAVAAPMPQAQSSFLGRYASLLTIVAVLFGATSGIFGSLVSAPSMAIGFWRLALAFPFFASPVLLSKSGRAELRRMKGKNYALCFVGGAFLFAHFFSWFTSVKLTNVASASVLGALHPLVVLVLTVTLYRRRVSWKSVAAICVALLGGAVIAFSGGTDLAASSGAKGNVFAFLAAVFMGLYFAVGDAVRREVKGQTYVFLVFTSSLICFTLGMVATGTDFLGYSARDFLFIGCLALICQLGAHGLFNLCIGHVSSLYVSAWESGDPVFATILGAIFLSQIPSAYEIIGCVIVVGALLYYNKQEQKRV